MGLADLFTRKKTTTLPEEALVKHGKTGTEILSGMIQEEYNNDLQFPDSVKIYDEMRRSDATIAALLKALKNPLLSAEWDVQAGGDEKRDKEIADFVDRNLFGNINFQDRLREILTYLDFGFVYFEKIFQVKNGMIEWKEFAPRLQKAHDKWTILGEEWRNGHPAGITQQINSDDESANVKYPTIPWEKLLLFTNDREGNNYEGISILRPAYKHYFYKDLGYKLQSVSAERYGVGMPVATVKNSMGKPNRTKVEEFLKNIRSNEKSYGLLTDEVSKFEIVTPNGTGVGAQIEKMIEHHDKKMYDLILAGFLNLTSGEGGSNALSKDQSSFFLRGLQSVADYIVSVMNEAIKELVDMNYSGVENYPTLFVSEIGQTSMDENIGAINTAVAGWLVKINDADEVAMRAILKLPPLPPVDEDDKDIDQMEAEMMIEEMNVGALESFAPKQEGEDVEDPVEEDMSDEKLAESLECIELGKPLSDEHKKKISEALRKRFGNGESADDIDIGTMDDNLDADPVVQKYEGDRERLVGMVDNLKTAIANLKDKRASMPKVQKKKFAGEFKKRLDELTQSRKNLEMIGKDLKKKDKERKNEISKYRKEVKKQIRAKKQEDAKQKKATREAEAEAKKANKNLAEGDKKKVPTPREKAFTKNITDFEKYLEGKYSEAEAIVAAAEKEYQDALIELYDGSASAREDGVVCLVFDKTKVTAGKNKVAAITAKLEKKLLGSDLESDIFARAISFAKGTLSDNEETSRQYSWSLDIPQSQINTFIEGYKSNMQGVIFNESRRVLESITLNYGSEASVELAKETAKAISFNRNILSLSFVTHPRALYKFIIYDESIGEGFTLFKPIVPNNRMADLVARPFGITAGIAYTILTAAQINAYAAKTTDGKTAEALTGLGLHHGSFEYYYPIASVDIDSEKEIAKIQRDEILNTNS